MHIHASCAVRDGAAVLLVGPAGSGKSDLLLRLLNEGFSLVADDQVVMHGAMASAPPALAGLLEVRGLGIIKLDHVAAAPVRLVVRLGRAAERLPQPFVEPLVGAPVIEIDPASASASRRVAIALDCALGLRTQVAGAFAA